MRIAVVIPTWNREELVIPALESVFAQTRPADEVVVVDDGSTDGTVGVLRRYEPRIRVVVQSNRGAAAARNRGLAEVTSEWVAFLDSDDLWEPTKLERQAEVADREAVDLVFCDSRPIDRDGRPLAGHRKPVVGGDVTVPLFASVFVHTPSVLAKTALLRRLGGFDESLRVCEDYDLWLRASLETRFGLAPEPLFVRRVHAQSLAHEDDPRHLDQKALVLARFAADPRAQAKLPRDLVRRRLTRVHVKAARAWLRHGDRARARRHVNEALALSRLNGKAWWLRLRTLGAAS